MRNILKRICSLNYFSITSNSLKNIVYLLVPAKVQCNYGNIQLYRRVYVMSFTKKMFQKDYICPYCFDRHPIYHVKFRCSNDLCEEKELDEKKVKFQGNRRLRKENIVLKYDLPEGLFQQVRTKMPSEMECHACNQNTTVRICPSCHSELPSTVSDFESLIFAV